MPAITDPLHNPIIKQAIDAFQAGDTKAWLTLFTSDALFSDDDTPGDLLEFTKRTLGHERFTSIEHSENDGLDIKGHFHSEQFGDVETFFRFQIDANGMIKRLDIGHA